MSHDRPYSASATDAALHLPLVVERLMDVAMALAEADPGTDDWVEASYRVRRTCSSATAMLRAATAPEMLEAERRLDEGGPAYAQRKAALEKGNVRRKAIRRLKADVTEAGVATYRGEPVADRRARQTKLVVAAIREGAGDETAIKVVELLDLVLHLTESAIHSITRAELVGPKTRLRELSDRQRFAICERLEFTVVAIGKGTPEDALSEFPLKVAA